jgi:hypothetical protein
MSVSLSAAACDASNVVATSREENSVRNPIGTVLEIFATSRKGPKWFPGLAKRLSKDKAPAAIHHLTGERERTCYDWCNGAVDPPARLVIKLLHTDVGWIVLEYLMRGSKQPWWLEVVQARACSRAYEAAREQLQLPLK